MSVETLYTAEEVAEKFLPFHPRTIKDFTRSGRIGYVLVGRKIRFRERDIAEFIEAGAKPLTPPQATPARNPKYTK